MMSIYTLLSALPLLLFFVLTSYFHCSALQFSFLPTYRPIRELNSDLHFFCFRYFILSYSKSSSAVRSLSAPSNCSLVLTLSRSFYTTMAHFSIVLPSTTDRTQSRSFLWSVFSSWRCHFRFACWYISLRCYAAWTLAIRLCRSLLFCFCQLLQPSFPFPTVALFAWPLNACSSCFAHAYSLTFVPITHSQTLRIGLPPFQRVRPGCVSGPQLSSKFLRDLM